MTRAAVVLALVVAGSLGAASAVGSTGPARPASCAVSDALAGAGAAAEARAAYVALVPARATRGCAVRGLLRLTRAPRKRRLCENGDDQYDAGRLDAARRAYSSLPPGTACADIGLSAIRELARLCVKGKVERDLGRESDATAAFAAALEKNPDARCARAGIAASRRPFWLKRWLDAFARWAPEALAALGIVLGASFLLLLLAYIPSVYRASVGWRVVGRILGPRLEVGKIAEPSSDITVGSALASRMKEFLRRFHDESLGSSVDYDLDTGTAGEEFAEIVSGSGRLQNALEKVRDASDHTKLVAFIVDLLYAALPIPRFVASGVCDPSEVNAASATLMLENNGRLAAAVTLSTPADGSAPTAADYLDLAMPGAVWVQYEVARLLGSGEVAPGVAESAALVREGLTLQQEGRATEARRAYEEAIEKNPRNWPAWVNLASVAARLEHDFPAAVEVVEEGLHELVEQAGAE